MNIDRVWSLTIIYPMNIGHDKVDLVWKVLIIAWKGCWSYMISYIHTYMINIDCLTYCDPYLRYFYMILFSAINFFGTLRLRHMPPWQQTSAFWRSFSWSLRSETHLVMLLLHFLLVAATQGKMIMMNVLKWGYIFLWLCLLKIPLLTEKKYSRYYKQSKQLVNSCFFCKCIVE